MSEPFAGKVVVVGGQGFLGRHILSAFVDLGTNVVPTSRAGDNAGATLALDLLAMSARTIRAELASISPDVVVNCVGLTTGRPAEQVDANVAAPIRLLTALADAAPTARLIHLGSAAEYGPSVSAGESVSEGADPIPMASYAITKLAGTRAVLTCAEDLGVAAVVLRVFNPVGGGCPPTTLPGRAALLLRATPPDGTLEMGSLEAFRDFVDVRDIAAAVVACAQADRLPSRLYNVGSGRAVRSRDLISELATIAGHRGEISERGESGERSAAVLWQQADIQRMRDELGWTPTHDLHESLRYLWRCA